MAKFFTISIGSNGSIVLMNSKNKVLKNLYCQDISDESVQKQVLQLFNKNKKLPVYLILDNIGQNYNKKSFPNVSIFDLQSLVRRKFNYEIPKDDLKDKRFIGRNKSTGSWEYMFISSPIDEVMAVWLNLLNKAENILAGIYMLPLEMEGMLKRLKKKLNVKKTPLSWDILLTENQVSGFREITFINGRLAFTRILTENTTEQGAFNTQFNNNISRNIDYLKRFYNNFNPDNLNIYTITNEEVKNLVLNLDTKDNLKIKPFSYEEFSSLFGLKSKLNGMLDYGDILFEELIMFSKKIISFSTRDMKQMAFLSKFSNIFQKISLASFAVLFISLIISFFSFTKYNYRIDEAKKKHEAASQKLESKKKEEFGDGILNLDEIIDITSFYEEIRVVSMNPFNLLKKFSSTFKNNEIIVNNLSWKLDNLVKNNLSQKSKNSMVMNSLLINKTGKIDDLFKVYENTNNLLKTNLSNYDITLSDLPKNINFNTNYFTFPVRINFVEK